MRRFTRKEFLRLCGCGFSLWVLSGMLSKDKCLGEEGGKALLKNEARFYEKLSGNCVQCHLCFRNCLIAPGQRGFCRNRLNREGRLVSLVYGKMSAIQVDPIEKEPQLHMLPGSKILCFGTAGCNFRCRFCHNWHLSQRSIEELEEIHEITPEGAVELALAQRIPTLSFTYNDPIAFYEFVFDTAVIAKQRGLRILWHSNGTLQRGPLEALLAYTDAVTIDLKGFSQKFYEEASSASLEPALETLKTIKKKGTWLEMVNLVIPTLNDDPQTIYQMAVWIRDNLGKDTPLHFSRFSPAYKLTSLPPTPVKTLEAAYAQAKRAGLEYVTIGNLPGHPYNSTYCPRCKKAVITRIHFAVLGNRLKDGQCGYCGHPIPGIWS